MIELIGDYVMLATGFILGYDIGMYITNWFSLYEMHLKMIAVGMASLTFLMMAVAGIVCDIRGGKV